MPDTFNRPTPPHFRGLHPDLPIRCYHRHLPHWRQDDATYFVTFRLADSIPQAQLQALKRWRTIWEQQHPEPRSEKQWKELAQEITAKTERWLDEGYGECLLGNPDAAKLMAESLQKFQDIQYQSFCFVVMPNHVHWVVKPFMGFELETILQNAKGYVSRQLNKRLGRGGSNWEEESYDRIIREDEHLWQIVQYIGRNPTKARLSSQQFSLWLHPEWDRAGWKFQAA